MLYAGKPGLRGNSQVYLGMRSHMLSSNTLLVLLREYIYSIRGMGTGYCADAGYI